MTNAQAKQIATFVRGSAVQGQTGGVAWPQLQAITGTHSVDEARGIAAQALRQTGTSDTEIGSLLQLPHGASVEHLIEQALVGAGLAAGVGFLGAGRGAAADTAVSSDAAAAEASGAGSSAAGGAAGGGAANALKKAASAATSNVGKAAAALSVGALFTQMGLWKGIGLTLAGAVLILIGILNLAGVDPGGIGHAAKKMIG